MHTEFTSSHGLLRTDSGVLRADGAEKPQQASAMAVEIAIGKDDEAECLHRRSAVVVFERYTECSVRVEGEI